jgi:hypothetical protein
MAVQDHQGAVPSTPQSTRTCRPNTAYVPTLQEILDLNKGKEKRKEEKEQERDKQRNRSVYFCLGYSKFWKEPIHKWLKKLRNRFDLRRLKISMPYHQFPNLQEMFAGDFSMKSTDGVESMDFKV